jgi:hypothetical protein
MSQSATEAPSPIVVYESKFPIVLEGHEYDLLTLVLDLPTGAGFPRHFHGGNVLVTVVSSEVTLEQGNVTKVIKTDERWTEKPVDVHAIINKGASARVWPSCYCKREQRKLRWSSNIFRLRRDASSAQVKR